MKSKIFEKLHSKAGESIGEVLVALLISALALVMLASMITSSSRMIQNSRVKMEEYYRANSILEACPAASGTTGSVTVKTGTPEVNVKLHIDDTGTYSVNIFNNDKAPSSTKVLSYRLK